MISGAHPLLYHSYIFLLTIICPFLLLLSWGTKGSDKADALPSISSKNEKSEGGAVVEETEKTSEDLEIAFKETVQRASESFYLASLATDLLSLTVSHLKICFVSATRRGGRSRRTT